MAPSRLPAAFIVFLALDVLLILVHIGYLVAIHTDAMSATPKAFDITRDWSLGELSNYFKWLGLTVVFFLAWRRRGENMLLALAGIAFAALLDDSSQWHENYGKDWLRALGVPIVSGTIPAALTELAFWGLIAACGVAVVWWLWARTSGFVRARVIAMTGIMAVVAVFGAGVDFIHYTMQPGLPYDLVGLLEDGGEMVGITALLGYTLWFFNRRHDVNAKIAHGTSHTP